MAKINQFLDFVAHQIVWALHIVFVACLRFYKVVRRVLTNTVHVYAAGGMQNARHSGKGWRTYFHHKLSEIFGPICLRLVYWNPCKFELNSDNFTVSGFNLMDVAKFKKQGKYVSIQRLHNRKILIFDCLKVIMSDIVIAKYDKAAHTAAGTKGEMTVAQFFKVPVYTWTTWHTKDLPSWIIGASTFFFKSPKDLFKFLADKYTSPFRKVLRFVRNSFRLESAKAVT